MQTRFLGPLILSPAHIAGRTAPRSVFGATVLVVLGQFLLMGALAASVTSMLVQGTVATVCSLFVLAGVLNLAPRLLMGADANLGPRGAIASRAALAVGLPVASAMGAFAVPWMGDFNSSVRAPAGVVMYSGAFMGTMAGALSLFVAVPVAWFLTRTERRFLDKGLSVLVQVVAAVLVVITVLGAMRAVRFPAFYGDGSRAAEALPWGWLTLAGLVLGMALTLVALQRLRLVPWSQPVSWLAARITADRWIRFAEGSAPRKASLEFGDWQGDVVVVPTADFPTGPFRGDGSPADGWVIPGTVSGLSAAVRTATIATDVYALAVLLVGLAPLLSAATLRMLLPW